MHMKKLTALTLSAAMVFSLAACGGGDKPSEKPSENPSEKPEVTQEITLWTYPIGKWGDQATVESLTAGFTAETGIKVNVEFLAYSDGDDKVNSAITSKSTPDLIMEGPERLVANWGANGYLVDLSDMLDEEDKAEMDAVNPGTLAACTTADGKVYEYPLVMTAHCMAVNLDAFKAAGADQYLDLETRTWTTENFIKAVEALYAKFGDTVGAVYCTGQGGDQGTRALVNNLYGGTFTDAEHTKYTWDDPLNIKALEQLKSMDGIAFDASLDGGKEIAKFYQGVLKMAFCWNIAQQLNPNQADTGAGKTITGEEIAFMAFPTESGDPKLQGGIWGFGIFDNGDDARIEASKKFIKYMADSAATADAVKAATYFPVRSAAEGTDLSGVWGDDAIMNEYQVLMPYLGDYYQVTKGWAGARTEWWTVDHAPEGGRGRGRRHCRCHLCREGQRRCCRLIFPVIDTT